MDWDTKGGCERVGHGGWRNTTARIDRESSKTDSCPSCERVARASPLKPPVLMEEIWRFAVRRPCRSRPLKLESEMPVLVSTLTLESLYHFPAICIGPREKKKKINAVASTHLPESVERIPE